MKRRQFFLTILLAPVVAFFKPAPKPSVAEIANAARSYKFWYPFIEKHPNVVVIWSLPESPDIWDRNKY